MFVRVKSTPKSPRKSVQIVESYRIDGKVRQRIVQHVGVAKDEASLKRLKDLAASIKEELESQGRLPLYPIENASSDSKASQSSSSSPKHESDSENEANYTVNLLNIVEESRQIKGIHDIYGSLYDELGFDRVIANPARNAKARTILKEIVLARIANPSSKRGSVEDLSTHFGVTVDLKAVYRMMDKIDDQAIERINTIAWEKCRSLYREKIDVLYFDATTLYFESFEEDELRRNGFSKDRKFNQPQVVLALLVSKEGLPVGYRLFKGDTFDGHTLEPTLEELKAHYDLDKVVYVADSGMFNRKNRQTLEAMEEKGVRYIVGAKIRNLPHSVQEEILDRSRYRRINDDLEVATFTYEGKRLIVSRSAKRARKDCRDREEGIERIRKKLHRSGSLKSHLSHQGYRKYLKIVSSYEEKCSQDPSLLLDEEKIAADARWDGLKGILSNETELSEEELIAQYANLWQIEESFRITKHDLRIRPIYHFKPERVKAHVAITFIAYTLVRHLAYRVGLRYKPLSVQRIRQVLLDVQVSRLYDTKRKIRFTLPSSLSLDAQKIYKIMGLTPQKRVQRVDE